VRAPSKGDLTIGLVGAVWTSRLRGILAHSLSVSSGIAILEVRVNVVQPLQ
jgi:hypothetical protein